MRRSRIGRIIRFLPFFILGAAVFGFLVMSLWNWLMPALFGVRPVGFWQALGIFILSKILFGGIGGGARHGGGYSRHRFMERWARMTPEEREQFREGLRRARGGPVEPPQPRPVP